MRCRPGTPVFFFAWIATGVPGQQCTVPLRSTLHRARDTCGASAQNKSAAAWAAADWDCCYDPRLALRAPVVVAPRLGLRRRLGLAEQPVEERRAAAEQATAA